MNEWQMMQELRTNVVESDNDRGCFGWGGRKSVKGYGKLLVDGREWRAHRLAYHVYVGDIPEGMMVLHRCDNPPCTNPDHLFLGDAKTNMDDCITKGRWNQVRDIAGKFLPK